MVESVVCDRFLCAQGEHCWTEFWPSRKPLAPELTRKCGRQGCGVTEYRQVLGGGDHRTGWQLLADATPHEVSVFLDEVYAVYGIRAECSRTADLRRSLCD